MSLRVQDFSYDLPASFIAQTPVNPRDSAKLLVLDRVSGDIVHRHVRDLIHEFRAGDVVVFNRSKVFRARLRARRESGGDAEVFILQVQDGGVVALLRPGKKIQEQAFLDLISEEGEVFLRVNVQKKHEDGTAVLDTGCSAEEFFAHCERYGSVPTPPYIAKLAPEEESLYQTVYAREVGSVAAPTAGLHFTPELLRELRDMGVQCEEVVLHVGIGTFRPMQTELLSEHRMHEEQVFLSEESARRIMQAKQEGRRIIAIGTTTVRVLEGVAALHGGVLRGFSGGVSLFITPGFSFAIISGLMTNFHLPESTLLVLVSAFAGRASVLHAYEEAKRCGYRFFSFGDAMFIR